MSLKERVLGVGHRVFTVIGLVAGTIVAASEYLDLIPEQYRSNKWYVLAAGIVAAGAWWKKNMEAPTIGLAPLVFVAAFLLASCAGLSRVSGSTGSLDLGKGYSCTASAEGTDASTCTKRITTSCVGPNGFKNDTITYAPVTKLADGTCP